MEKSKFYFFYNPYDTPKMRKVSLVLGILGFLFTTTILIISLSKNGSKDLFIIWIFIASIISILRGIEKGPFLRKSTFIKFFEDRLVFRLRRNHKNETILFYDKIIKLTIHLFSIDIKTGDNKQYAINLEQIDDKTLIKIKNKFTELQTIIKK